MFDVVCTRVDDQMMLKESTSEHFIQKKLTYLPTYFVCVAHCHPVRTFDAFIKVNTYTEHKSSNSSSWYRNIRGCRNKRRCFPFFFLSTYFEDCTPTADAIQLDICEIRLLKNF